MITKEDRAEALTKMYLGALKALENDEANDFILVPFKRGDYIVEVIFTNPAGEKQTTVIHKPF